MGSHGAPQRGAALRRLKRAAREIIGGAHRRLFNVRWNPDPRVKVLVETGRGFAAADWTRSLDDGFAGWERAAEVHFTNNSLERRALASDMEIYVSTWLTQDLMARSRHLRWVHFTVAGVEFLDATRLPPHVQITTAGGVAAGGIAEHVVGLMIALDRRMDLALLRQRQWTWDERGIADNIRGLKGRTVGIVGMGRNGRAVAGLARAMGMRVIGLDRQPGLCMEGVERIYGTEALLDLLRESDFTVLCIPLTRETRGLIGSRQLAVMGRDSYLINVARGEVVDEDALARALRGGIIAGAALDVLSVEPPPRSHPLRRCPNLIVTPHVAGNIYTFRKEIRDRFVRNLKAFLSCGELEGVYQRV